jgi:hypothetical protein
MTTAVRADRRLQMATPRAAHVPCADCAFRPGSKELCAFVLFLAGPMVNVLDRLCAHIDRGEREAPFFCHPGKPTDEDGHYVAEERTSAGVPIGWTLCSGYARVRGEGRATGDLVGEWLSGAIRKTRNLIRIRIGELRRHPDPLGLQTAAILGVLLGDGSNRRNVKAWGLIREDVLRSVKAGRFSNVEEAAEAMTRGGTLMLPALIDQGATWMPSTGATA